MTSDLDVFTGASELQIIAASKDGQHMQETVKPPPPQPIYTTANRLTSGQIKINSKLVATVSTTVYTKEE
jgi:hypothetical protein